MKRIRVILIGLAQMLREIVTQAVGREPDIEIVRNYPPTVDLATAVTESKASVVIASAAACDPSTVRRALGKSPQVKIVSISDDAQQIALYEFAVRRRNLGDLSPAQLLAAIRSAVTPS
jgi:DNA-binding NarL/FixJ family response regulator